MSFRRHLPAALRALPWKAHPLDGRLLLFERATGLNLLLEGPATAHLRRAAPRTLNIAVTNVCNLACPFCYRDLNAPSRWTFDELLAFCEAADAWGVLEVAFGGGEPLMFPYFQDLLLELHARTRLALNFTTNGTLLTAHALRALRGVCGQIRLSLYSDNNWRDAVRLLVSCQARFGVNWLITPAEVPALRARWQELLALGVRDVLLLRYKGPDPDLHLNPAQLADLSAFVREAYQRAGRAVSIKLDACWGSQLAGVPRLFSEDDCGAGDDFLTLTSDKRLQLCSFHHLGRSFETLDDVRAYWQARRCARPAAHIRGCARPGSRALLSNGAERYASFALVAI